MSLASFAEIVQVLNDIDRMAAIIRLLSTYSINHINISMYYFRHINISTVLCRGHLADSRH